MTFHVEGFTVRLFLATARYITLFLLFTYLFIYFYQICNSTDERLVILNDFSEEGREAEICRRR